MRPTRIICAKLPIKPEKSGRLSGDDCLSAIAFTYSLPKPVSSIGRVPYRNALIDDRYVTRLGEGTVTVATPSLVSPFTGGPIAALPIPISWLARVNVDFRDWVEGEQEAVVNGRQVQIGALILTYDRLGLQRENEG